jgi:hypothetical protein
MEALAMMLFPVLLILFALVMERFEARLSRLSVPEMDVKRFLEEANNDEVATLADMGMSDALDRFNRRLGRDLDVYPDEARRAS